MSLIEFFTHVNGQGLEIRGNKFVNSILESEIPSDMHKPNPHSTFECVQSSFSIHTLLTQLSFSLHYMITQTGNYLLGSRPNMWNNDFDINLLMKKNGSSVRLRTLF